jgi:hypothetical protein
MRIATVMDLPPRYRDQANAALERFRANPYAPVDAAAQRENREALRKAHYAEQRERHVLALLIQLRYVGLDTLFVREHRFHPQRRWALDLYADAHTLGIELQGGLHDPKRSHHTLMIGYLNDREKINSAIEHGIRVLEYGPQSIADGSAVLQIERIVRAA